jgi:hypothetical protein
MPNDRSEVTRAIELAAATGLRVMMGPAALAIAEQSENKTKLVTAALAEMVIDKIPFLPSRDSFPLLVARAAAGAWTAHQSLKRDGVDASFGPILGAGVAAATAFTAPKVRATLGVVLPDLIVGLAEDYLALRLASDGIGEPWMAFAEAGLEAVDEVRKLAPQS